MDGQKRQVIDVSGLTIAECHQIIFLCESHIRKLRQSEEKIISEDIAKVSVESKRRIDAAMREEEAEQARIFRESLHGNK